MKVSVVIPAKGTSVRVKNKNLYEIEGKSLVRRACEKFLSCKAIQNVYLDTEDDGIILTCSDLQADGLKILKRPKELATNEVGANEMLIYALHSIDHCDLLLQGFSTSPTITPKTIDKCVNKFLDKYDKYDSFFTVVEMQEYFWKKNEPQNFDLSELPNSVDLEPILMETHGLYGIKTEALLKYKTRIGKKPLLIKIPKIEAFDVDDYEDLEIVERLLKENK